jgi:hypothetical protein
MVPRMDVWIVLCVCSLSCSKIVGRIVHSGDDEIERLTASMNA